MAISLVQQTQTFSTTAVASLGKAFVSDTTTGNTIIVTHGTVTNGANSITSVTDSQGNVYLKAKSDVASAHRVEIWYAENITGGTTPTVTITFSANSRSNMSIHEISGLSTKFCFDNAFPKSGSGTPATGGSTYETTQPNEFVLSMTCINTGTGVLTVGSGYSNLIQQVNSTVGLSGVSSKIVAAKGSMSDSMSYTGGGGSWRSLIATFSDTIVKATVINNYQFVTVGDGMSTSEKIR